MSCASSEITALKVKVVSRAIGIGALTRVLFPTLVDILEVGFNFFILSTALRMFHPLKETCFPLFPKK